MINHMEPRQIRELIGIQEGIIDAENEKKAVDVLSVQKANYAVKMYKKAGFKTVDENEEEYIMTAEL